MKDNYDFTKGRRGAVVSSLKKTRISIRLDQKVVGWFKDQVKEKGGRSYQALMNQVLLEYVNSKGEPLENVLRRVIREEMYHDHDGIPPKGGRGESSRAAHSR